MSDWLKNVRFDRSCANPIAAQLSIMLKRLIIDGKIEVGSRLPAARSLTKTLGIAYKNVDKALRQLTREGFLDRVPGKGTFVKRGGAQRRRTGDKIVFICPYEKQSDHPYTHRVFRGLRSSLDDNKLDVILRSVDHYKRNGKRWWEEVLQVPRVQGFVLDNEEMLTIEVKKFMDQTSLPVVVVNSGFSIRYPRLPVVIPEYSKGMAQLTSFLIDLAHKRMALLLETRRENSKKADTSKFNAFLASMEQKGLNRKDALVHWGLFDNLVALENVAGSLLSHPDPPTAILCANDLMAYRLIEILQRKGFDVPSDISVTGFNNYDVAFVTSPAITTVNVPMWEIGRLAGHKLYNLIHGHYESNETYLPVELIVRESTGHASTAHPLSTPKKQGAPYEKYAKEAS